MPLGWRIGSGGRTPASTGGALDVRGFGKTEVRGFRIARLARLSPHRPSPVRSGREHAEVLDREPMRSPMPGPDCLDEAMAQIAFALAKATEQVMRATWVGRNGYP